MATVQLSTAKFIYAMASHKSNVATHVANDPIRINAFVSEQGYCELGWDCVFMSLSDEKGVFLIKKLFFLIVLLRPS